MVLLESISGLRGYGEDFMARAGELCLAFAFEYPSAVFGRDTRIGELAVIDTARNAYLGSGGSFCDLGIVPTPTVQLVAKDYALNGMMATASHNPLPWLGLKLFTDKGMLSHSQLSALQAAIQHGMHSPGVGREIPEADLIRDKPVAGSRALGHHISRIAENIGEDEIEAIRRAGFTVLVDHVSGAGYSSVPALLEYLGCKAISMPAGKPTGILCRPCPEPIPENLPEFSHIIKNGWADIGFAVDPDVDRLVIGLPGLGCISEEFTLALVVKYFTQTSPKGTVAANLSTSRMSEDIARQAGWNYVRTPVGERNVLDGMAASGAVIGGEGNGGVINHALAPCRDALYGIALVLSYAARHSTDSLLAGIPSYHMKKTNVPGRDYSSKEQALASMFPDGKKDYRDGLRIDLEYGWLHVRPSNTEPIVRIIAEAQTEPELEYLISTATNVINS